MRLLGAGQRVDGGAQDIRLLVVGELAAGLLDFVQLRLVLKGVEQEHAAVFRQAQAGRNSAASAPLRLSARLRALCRVGRPREAERLQSSLLVFVGGVPVDQVLGDLLPFAALGAVVADAVAFNFVFRSELVSAVFEDQALGQGLGEGRGAPVARLARSITMRDDEVTRGH